MMNQVKKKRQDYWLSLAIFGLIVFGLIMIYSVSKYYSLQITDEQTDKFYLVKQLRFVVIGIIAWIIFQAIDYRFWQQKSSMMFFITLVLLMLPLLPFGHGGGAGGRWVNLGFTSFQPSELAKLTTIIYLSGWFASKKDDVKQIEKMFVPFIGLVIAISFLMLIQKDLGTLSVLISICAFIFIIAGVPAYQLVSGCGIGAILVWLAIKIEPYRMERLMTFLNPGNEALGSGYHIRNALIAIGSGGLFGMGFGQSKQKYLYLPEAHTDSIFAIICEELGFIRAAAIILIFAFIAIRGYKIARYAPDTFSRLVATGITTWILMQTLINVGAMMSILPLTGVPLPFVSYGGTSLVILLAAVGILMNISKNQIATSK